MQKIRIGIIGYGNLGRGVEAAVRMNEDMELVGIFTRRDPESLQTQAPAFAIGELDRFAGEIDVCILCGGSATDIVEQGPMIARRFNFVDAFDTHAKIPAYYEAMDAVAKECGHTGIISTGWDPGLFSMMRVLMEAVLPNGHTETFWGKGVSQGHSDALRHIEGVKGAVQYTIPNEAAIERIRSGELPELTARQKHTRECFIVLEEGADFEAIREQIVTMPNYFADYDTTVHVISAEELARDHSGMPHGGRVIRTGSTAEGMRQVIEFGLALESNPEFTASVNVAFARAAARFAKEGHTGAKTVADIPLGYLSKRSPEDIRKNMI